jgi:hypothetical protein
MHVIERYFMNYFISIMSSNIQTLIKRNLTDMSTLLAAGASLNENHNLMNRVRNSTDAMSSQPLRPLQMIKEANA